MAKTKDEKPEHVKIIEKVEGHVDDLEAFVRQVKSEHEDIIRNTENETLAKLGGDFKKYDTYLKSKEGAEAHAKTLSDKFYKKTLESLNIKDDSKIKSEWKERLIELNGVNYDILLQTIRASEGKFDLDIYKKQHLGKHVESLYQQGIAKAARYINEKYIPDILKHLKAHDHMDITDTFKHKNFVPGTLNAILGNKDNRLYDALKNDEIFSAYLKKPENKKK
jgi:hypothetical protein